MSTVSGRKVAGNAALNHIGDMFITLLRDKHREWGSMLKWEVFVHCEASRCFDYKLLPALMEDLHWSEIASAVKVCRKGGARSKAKVLGVALLARFLLIEAKIYGYSPKITP